jgi:5-(carboxyamino)imidazole ribonucleotide synthase
VIAPASVSQIVEATAYNIAASLLTKLSYVGVMTLEFFYGSDGLFVNEIAPRTHNSGHFSIEACSSSQFDQQLCIAAGLDVPNPEFIADGSLMVNLLGLGADQAEPLEERLSKLRSIEGLHLHWYGKNEIPGRKVGHVTTLLNGCTADERAERGQQMLQRIREIWPLPLNW